MCEAISGTSLLLFTMVALSAADLSFMINNDGVDIEYVYHAEAVSWLRAMRRCWASGGRLWVPGGDLEQRWVRTEVSDVAGDKELWTGINHLYSYGVYQDTDGKPISLDIQWQWSWYQGKPDPSDGDNRCVLLLPASTLYAHDCDQKLPYLCQSTTPNRPDAHDKIPRNANISFTILGRPYVYHAERVTWAEAWWRCWTAGAQLLGPADEAEARAVAAQAARVDPHRGIWTNANDAGSQAIHGSSVRARSLGAVCRGRRRGRRNVAACVGLRPDSSKYDADCDFPGPYVCRFPATTERAGAAPTTSSEPSLPVYFISCGPQG